MTALLQLNEHVLHQPKTGLNSRWLNYGFYRPFGAVCATLSWPPHTLPLFCC